jgi:hypothetical protein
MAQPNDSLPIAWYIDRNPDYTFNNITNISLTNYENQNWLSDSVNYRRDFNTIYENTNRYINSQWISDSYYDEPHSSIVRNSRYFNHINTINNLNFNNRINSNRTVETTNSLNNEDFIPFGNSRPQNRTIHIDITNFTVSEEERQCCICMEERLMEEICRLNCQHTFCVQCINRHIQTNHSCPICRSDVTNLSVQNNGARDSIHL